MEKLKKLEEREERLKKQKRELMKKVNNQKRKDRNHHMIKFGTMVEAHLDIDHLNIYEKRELLNTVGQYIKEKMPDHLKKENYDGSTNEDNIYTFKLSDNELFEDQVENNENANRHNSTSDTGQTDSYGQINNDTNSYS